jgi:hypothetical protein
LMADAEIPACSLYSWIVIVPLPFPCCALCRNG